MVFVFYVCVSFLFVSMFFYLFSFGRQLKKNLAGYPATHKKLMCSIMVFFFVMFNNFPYFFYIVSIFAYLTIWYYLLLFYFIIVLSLFTFFPGSIMIHPA